MTKAQLLRAIQHLNDDDEILIAFPSGDYWGTVLARPVSEACEDHVKPSSYYDGRLQVTDDLDSEELQRAFVLFPPEAL